MLYYISSIHVVMNRNMRIHGPFKEPEHVVMPAIVLKMCLIHLLFYSYSLKQIYFQIRKWWWTPVAHNLKVTKDTIISYMTFQHSQPITWTNCKQKPTGTTRIPPLWGNESKWYNQYVTFPVSFCGFFRQTWNHNTP